MNLSVFSPRMSLSFKLLHLHLQYKQHLTYIKAWKEKFALKIHWK